MPAYHSISRIVVVVVVVLLTNVQCIQKHYQINRKPYGENDQINMLIMDINGPPKNNLHFNRKNECEGDGRSTIASIDSKTLDCYRDQHLLDECKQAY